MPTIDDAIALLAKNEHAWRETLLKQILASTGRPPEDFMLVTQIVHDEQRIWFEPREDQQLRERANEFELRYTGAKTVADRAIAQLAELEQQLATVTKASADWARRAGAAERRIADDNTRIEALIESRDYYANRTSEQAKRIADLENLNERLTAQAIETAERLATPDFARLLEKRVSECTEAERGDALEGWLRKNVRYFDYFDPIGMSHYELGAGRPRNHIEFLLRRIDALRNPPKD
jgi:hypothetical protein